MMALLEKTESAHVAPKHRTEGWLKGVVWILNLLLAGGIAYDGYRIYRSELHPEGDQPRVAERVLADRHNKAAVVSELAWQEWHPFGMGEVGGGPTPVAVVRSEEAPDTQLNLALTGVLSDARSGRSWVMVRGGSENEKIFASTEKLPGDARIVTVRPDRVILEKGGRMETLRLPKNVVPLDGKSARSAEPPPNEAILLLKQLREEFLANPQAVLARIALQPVNKDGVFGGYVLHPGNEPGVLEKLGLAAGDVITSVNGVALSSPQKGMEAMASLGKSQSLRLTLLRSGKSVTVEHTLGPH
ncbi:MAG: type II secretion system protein GspC [Magnetococcales bacterium]|nr:type II secretion system protein GspC [Magnetococcales bacterium]